MVLVIGRGLSDPPRAVDRLFCVLDVGPGGSAPTTLDKAGPATKEAFRERAEGVVTRATGMGWGYYDYLADRFAEAYPE